MHVNGIWIEQRLYTIKDRKPEGTIIFLHGLGGDMYGMMDDAWREPLMQKYDVLYYSQRGHGGSSNESMLDYSLRQYADDLEEIIKAHEFKHVSLIGFSLGGMVAQKFACRDFAHKVLDKMVLVQTFSYIDGKFLRDFFVENYIGTLVLTPPLKKTLEGLTDQDLNITNIKIEAKTLIVECQNEPFGNTDIQIPGALRTSYPYCGHGWTAIFHLFEASNMRGDIINFLLKY
jgi:pimeloyl-ACP methyl ester carboxylesterase